LHNYLQPIAGSILLAVFGLLIQLSAFWLMGDSVLPVSAIVKTEGSSRGLSIESVEKFAEVVTLGMPSILQGKFPPFVLISIGMIGILFVVGLRMSLSHLPTELSLFLDLWSSLLVGETLYHLYIATSGVQYTLYFIWYRSPSFIFWIITFSLIALLTLEYIKPVKQLTKNFKWAPIGFSLILVAVAIYMFARSINFTSNLYVARYEAALWIEDNFPPDAVFASWNTGQLGFFSNRTFINLDGVINHIDYYERVLSGPVPLTEYLFENRVDYVVDYDTYNSLPDYPVIRSFPLNDESGRSIQIWQVPSRISSQ
jgi:hypothetical protein